MKNAIRLTFDGMLGGASAGSTFFKKFGLIYMIKKDDANCTRTQTALRPRLQHSHRTCYM